MKLHRWVWPPLLGAVALAALAWKAWPGKHWPGGWLAWINLGLLGTGAAALLGAAIKLLHEGPPPPGVRLRIKMQSVIGVLVLVPVLLTQYAASAIVDKGLATWFDVRVERLLDEALAIAQGFYARLKSDVRRDAEVLARHPAVVAAALQSGAAETAARAMQALARLHGWTAVELFDAAGRLVVGLRGDGTPILEPMPWSEGARIAARLGRSTVEVLGTPTGEEVRAHAPVRFGGVLVGLVRVTMEPAAHVAKSARAIERDYRKYRVLARERAALRELFVQATLFVGILAGGLGVWLAGAFARRIAHPLGEIAEALARVGEGDVQARAPVRGNDEIAELARAFNAMAERLQRNLAAIERTQRELAEALGASRQRQQILEALLARLDVGVVLVDAALRIRLVNAAWHELLELGEDWAPGASLAARATGKCAFLREIFDELVHTHDRVDVERDWESPTRGLRRLSVHASWLEGAGRGAFTGVLFVVADITELARAEEARAWAEVARRLAHEIKNPLTPVRLAAERMLRKLRDKLAGQDAAVLERACTTIVSQVQRLERLVNDFSRMARLPRPEPVPVRAADVLAEIAELYRPRPEVCVEMPKEALIALADADLIKQVLINLVENALFAVGERAAAGSVRVGAASGADGWVEFIVEDDGPGVEESVATRLFEPYVSTKPGGSGLGLAIARRIAEEHGGELVLARRKKPTRFVLRLPAAREEGA